MSDIQTQTTKYTCKIAVTTHKQYRMPEDPMYLPLHVGAAIERRRGSWKEPDLGYIKDNTGENISSRNACFCELTGLYWMWKHVDADYIGLVHYRRHFRGRRQNKTGGPDVFRHVLSYDELSPMLGRYKVFVPRKRYYVIESLYSHYKHTHYIEHLDKTREIIGELYPDYLATYDEVMKETSAHMFNMMIMERKLLDEYCAWLFHILFTLEKQIDVSEYSYFQGRYAGRVGELIFNVWLAHQVKTGRIAKDEIKVLPYLYVEKVDWWKKGKRFLRAKFMNQKYE